MRKFGFSGAHLVGILKEDEQDAKVYETCRKHCVSEPTDHKWTSQVSGMAVPHQVLQRVLKGENAKFKCKFADRAFVEHALKDFVDRTI